VERAKNLSVFNVPAAASQALARLAQRSMRFQCTIQDGQIWMTADDQSVQIDFIQWKASQAA
jgi:uncharacterized protein YaeQ